MIFNIDKDKFYLSLLFTLTSLSLSFNFYAYNEILKLSNDNDLYKIALNKLEAKMALLPEKVVDAGSATKIQIITQSDSVISYIYLGASVIGIILLFYFIYTIYIQLCGLFSVKTIASMLVPLSPYADRFFARPESKHIEAVDFYQTIIRMDIKNIDNIDTLVLSIKRVGDASFTVIDNIGKFIVDNPAAVIELTEKSAELFKGISLG